MFLGPPGSGKGTQATGLADERGWIHVSTGDLFREHLRRGSALGELARGYIDRGELVPDRVTVDMVRERLRVIGAGTPVVFDGFPRTLAQAEALDELLGELGRGVRAALLLEVPGETLVRRIAWRATCANCHTVYNLKEKPLRVAGVCDRCGGPVSQRSDETPEVVRRRLEVFERDTGPLAAYYEARGVLARLDGDAPVDEVARRIAVALS